MDREFVTRREYLLTSGAVGLAAVAGCSGEEPTTEDENEDEEPTAAESESPTETETDAATETSTPEEEPTEEEESDGEGGEPQALGDEWRMFQNGVGRSGYNAENTAPSGEVTEAWRYELDGFAPAIQPTLVDGSVYTAFNCSERGTPQLCLVAVDAITGEEEWRESVTPKTSISSLVELHAATAYGGGRIYAETGRGYLVAVDADSGSVQWDRTFESVSGSLDGSVLYADGILYAHAGPTGNTYNENEGGIRALDAATGEVRWSFTERQSFGTLGLVDGTLIAKGDSRATTYGLNPETGDKRWESEQYTTSQFGSSDGTCYVYGGDASAFTAGGSLVWERENVGFTPRSPSENGPAIANGRAFFPTSNSGIVALDTASGEELWRVGEDDGAQNRITGSPALGGDGETVYTTAETYALAIDAATGDIQWQYDLPDFTGYASDIVVGNEALYLSCDSSDGPIMLALA